MEDKKTNIERLQQLDKQVEFMKLAKEALEESRELASTLEERLGMNKYFLHLLDKIDG